MAFLFTHIPLLFGAASSLIMLISMSAVTVTTFQYLRAMEAGRIRIQAEEESPCARHRRP